MKKIPLIKIVKNVTCFVKSSGRLYLFLIFIFLGLLLSIAAFLIYLNYLNPLHKNNFYNIEFPWTLISTLAIGPITLYLWYSKHNNEKQALSNTNFQVAYNSLSSKKPQERIAGILVLESIVHSNHKMTSHVIELLTTHLRINNQNYQLNTEINTLQIEQKLCLDIISRIWNKYHYFWNFSTNENPDLRDITMNHIDLWGVVLKRFYLLNANFRDLSLKEANFQNANLSFAVFNNVNLKNTNFDGAILNGADLSRATNLTSTQLKGAYGCPQTKLPDKISLNQIGDKYCYNSELCSRPCKTV